MAHHSHIGARSIDEYAYLSGMKNVNSGLKVFASVCMIIISISSAGWITPLFCAICCGAVSIVFGKVRLGNYISLLTIPFVFMIMSSAAISMTVSLREGFSVCFYRQDVMRAAVVSAKAFGAVSSMYMLSLSTPVTEIVYIMGKLCVPEIICELMRLMYRYIFILADAQVRMKNAAQSRLGYVTFRRSVRTFGLICSNLLAVSLRRASDYYNAVESRSGEERLKFLRCCKPVKAAHIAAFGGSMAAAAGIEIVCRILK